MVECRSGGRKGEKDGIGRRKGENGMGEGEGRAFKVLKFQVARGVVGGEGVVGKEGVWSDVVIEVKEDMEIGDVVGRVGGGGKTNKKEREEEDDDEERDDDEEENDEEEEEDEEEEDEEEEDEEEKDEEEEDEEEEDEEEEDEEYYIISGNVFSTFYVEALTGKILLSRRPVSP